MAKRSSISGLFGGVEVDGRMDIPLPAGSGIRGGMDWSGSGEGIPDLFYFIFIWKQELDKGKGGLELGVGGEQCGHRKVNGGRRERTDAENPKAK